MSSFNRLIKGLAVSALIAISTSCIGTSTSSLKAGSVPVPTPDPSRNEALVCVYRTGFYAAAQVMDAYLDNQVIGALPTGRWTYALTTSGTHELKVTTSNYTPADGITETSHIHYKSPAPLIIPSWKAERNRFTLRPGDRRYFKVGLGVAGMTTNLVKVREVSESRALKEIEGMAFSTIAE